MLKHMKLTTIKNGCTRLPFEQWMDHHCDMRQAWREAMQNDDETVNIIVTPKGK